MRTVITAGATREYIDDIRYITNPSSGKMGAALAKAALENGFEACMVHGPGVKEVEGVQMHPVETCQQMIKGVLEEIDLGCDILVSAAAISDYRPTERIEGKLASGEEVCLKLVPTPKLLEKVRELHPRLGMAGFKAETGLNREKLEDKARSILERYGLELVVANDVSQGVFGEDETNATIVFPQGSEELGVLSKLELARRVFSFFCRT